MDFIPPNYNSIAIKQHTIMKNASKIKPGKRVSAQQIARMAERGNDVSRFFSNTGKMMRPNNASMSISSHPMLLELSKQSRKKIKERLKHALQNPAVGRYHPTSF